MSVISAAKFRDELERWGVDFVEHSRHDRCLNRTVDWSDHEARRGRDCARRGWDAHGIAIHHSGGPTSWQFVWDGRSDVPGPLYTVLIYPDGIAHLTGFRITNNVGRCDKTVRDAVLGGRMPTSGGNVSPGVDDYAAANSEFYGISYRGTAPNAAQRRTAVKICAAICSAHGRDWDGGSIAGHKELTRRKPDPEGENMSAFRADVNKALKAGPGGIDMAVSNDDARTIARHVWAHGIDVEPSPEVRKWSTGHVLSWMIRTQVTAGRRDETVARAVELLEAMADRELGADATEIKAHIDQRHAEAAQQRETIATTMTDKLDAIVEATQGADPAEAKLAAIMEILGV